VNRGFVCAFYSNQQARREEASDANQRYFIWRLPMMDAVMMAIALVFFALSIAYAYACDWL
jgi:hypothetical protein